MMMNLIIDMIIQAADTFSNLRKGKALPSNQRAESFPGFEINLIIDLNLISG
jgi:hypothetical protein